MLFLTLLAAPTWAQDTFTAGEVPTLNAQSFRPSLDAQTFLRTTDSALLRNKAFFGRALFQYANKPLVYYPYNYEDTGEATVLVDSISELDVMGGATFGPVRAGVLIPVYLRSSGGETAETGLGDLMADVKFRAIDRDEAPIGLAFSGRVGLPTATTTLPLSAGGLFYEVEAAVDATVGESNILALDVGQRGQPEVALENATWGSQLYANIGGSHAFSAKGGAALELTTSFTEADFGNTGVMPVEGILSGWLRPGDEDSALVLHAGLGMGITKAVSAPAWRALLTVAWDPQVGSDRDADGLVDDVDSCPDNAEDMDNVKDADGCPEATKVTVLVVDQWGDAVTSARWMQVDKTGSPGETLDLNAGTYQFTATAEGYTPGQSSLVVTDADDATVTVVTPMILGSLTVVAKDNLGQTVSGATWHLVGVKDAKNNPAGTAVELKPGEYHLMAEAEGYRPVMRDATVIREKEALVVFEMVPAKAKVTAVKIDIKDKVYFETAKAIIKPESFALLDEVAEIITNHPELTKIRIEGHTDTRSDAAYNKTLSQNRANSVRDYLVGKGVAATRLEAVGYGEERPIVKEKTEADRAMNRRVEFFVAERSDNNMPGPAIQMPTPGDKPKVDQ